MKHIKTYENWFTNLFKDSEYDIWWNNDFNNKMELSTKYNTLMITADDGDLKKFKHYFANYINNLNDISNEGKNVLHYVVTGDGDLYNKKGMVKILIDNGIDYTIKCNNETFYDMIKEPKLKRWFDKTYPNIVKELNIIKDTDKYNL